jgi:AraC-like DNA-binding protein
MTKNEPLNKISPAFKTKPEKFSHATFVPTKQNKKWGKVIKAGYKNRSVLDLPQHQQGDTFGKAYGKNYLHLNMLMKATKITSCYIGPQISPEQFIAEHFFLYLAKGTMHGYDGNKNYTLKSGECCFVRKNHLARYNKQKQDGEFEKVVVIFDEAFLKKYQEKHNVPLMNFSSKEAFLAIRENDLIPNFLRSLSAYYNGEGKIKETFADVKREELLLILLQTNPELANVLFDFGIPEKIDLESFMNKNFRFNVAIQRFAYLTGRSLTSFKRDFEKTFNDTPSRWLIQKRLQEAYFLMDKKGHKASDVYIDVGFEDLSHFSFAFKKMFGFAPTQLTDQKKQAAGR